MPTQIPFDSSLVLGNIVSKEKLAILEQIASAQSIVDAIRVKLRVNGY
jgi:hypothetical protein